MGLIGAVLLFFANVFSSLLANEFKAWAPQIVRCFIKWAVARLPQDRRERFEEEWTSHVNDVPGDLCKVIVAFGFLSAAVKMSLILSAQDKRLVFDGFIKRLVTSVVGLARSGCPRVIYQLCRITASPLLVFYFLYRSARDRRYITGFGERLGFLPASFNQTTKGSIWLHAVSVCEVIAAGRLLQELRKQSPSLLLYVSVSTIAGREVARHKLSDLADGVFYAPIDYAFAVRRVLRQVHPSVIVIIENEVWPVLYREAKRAGCGLLIVNGRISDRTFARYCRFRFLFRPTLSLPDAIFTQSQQDRTRYVQIGAPVAKVLALGNLKYDTDQEQCAPPQLLVDLLEELRPRTVWIAANTMPGVDHDDIDEDDAVVHAFRELAPAHPDLLLILAPRRPDCFDSAEERLRVAGIRYIRRSRDAFDPSLALPCVVLLDSMGELAGLFPIADVVFIGASLARRGGYNLLEPAMCGSAIVAGPHMENFAVIAAEFTAAEAMVNIPLATRLAEAVHELLADPDRATAIRARARALAKAHRGLVTRVAQDILWHAARVVPSPPQALAARLFLTPLFWLRGVRNQSAAKAVDAKSPDSPSEN